jgi:hypothetical protein
MYRASRNVQLTVGNGKETALSEMKLGEPVHLVALLTAV